MTARGDRRPEEPPGFSQGEAHAATALAVLAVDPFGLGGAVVRGCGSEARAWADAFCAFLAGLPDSPPVSRLPLSATVEGVSGGLDVAATLIARAPRVALGLLPRTHGGVVVAPCAERLSPAVLSELCDALDQGAVSLSRDGLTLRAAARVTLLALDSGGKDEAVADALSERLALHIEATGAPPALAPDLSARILQARVRLDRVNLTASDLGTICAVAEAFGEPSLRAARFCARAAAALAALRDRPAPTAEDVALAAALVIGPRARRLPAALAEPQTAATTGAASQPATDAGSLESSDTTHQRTSNTVDVEEMAIASVRESLAPDIFGREGSVTRNAREGGRKTSRRGLGGDDRGAPAGVRRAPRGARRFALAETLKAAAPWQTLRRPPQNVDAPAIRVAASDLRIHRRRQRPRTTVTLVVDASGSAAVQRLAETKGAVEHLLDRCYARRDEVALLTFRNSGAQVVLPPTRSLTRVRRRLGELTAGGPTPLASAVESGARVALAARERGTQALLVLLSDGRGNVTRSGEQGRAAGRADAMDAARTVRTQRLDSVFVDISPRGEPQAREIADAMGARYLRLPHVEARALAQAVRAAAISPAVGKR